MTNKGITLAEFIVTMAMAAIIVLGIAFLFWTSQTLLIGANKKIALERETAIAMDHMARILRFAKPDTIVVDSEGQRITADVEGGHLAAFPDDDQVRYMRISAEGADLNKLQYSRGNPASLTDFIAENISVLDFTWTEPYLTIDLTVNDGTNTVPIHTKLKVLGE